MNAFDELRSNQFKLNSRIVRNVIDSLIRQDDSKLSIDRRVRRYYCERNQFIWIDRLGVRNNSDTLLKVISRADYYGLDVDALRASQIEKDIESLRNLNFNSEQDGINLIMGRLEYNLTRAYFRYTAGQNYGFVNADYLYNHLYVKDGDSTSTNFIQLSDLHPKRPDDKFYDTAVRMAIGDSLSFFLTSVIPKSQLHKRLIDRLNHEKLSVNQRAITCCNIERCRWKLKRLSNINDKDKHVVVNIPSFSLRAYNNGNIMTMKVGCGELEHKTPLLASSITRMDINPQWIVPKSIAKGIVYRHSYMRKQGMFVYDKAKGKLPPESASYDKIMTGEQCIIQAGGPLNSLGRIIFRFDNNFSVFLHDTSSPWVFNKRQRDVSHGCVRVERPLELAMFMLGEKDDDTEEKLKYSMTVDLSRGDSLNPVKINKSLLVNSVRVKPSVPLFITYYTVYYDDANNLSDYPDVYGYDEVLLEELSPFIR